MGNERKDQLTNRNELGEEDFPLDRAPWQPNAVLQWARDTCKVCLKGQIITLGFVHRNLSVLWTKENI